MKKSLLVLLFSFLLLSLNGCYFFENVNKTGVLEDISFYDIDENIIEGEYHNYFSDYFDFLNSIEPLSNKIKITPINSPAPLEKIYCADIKSGKSVIVCLKIRCYNNYKVTGVRIGQIEYSIKDFYKLTVETGDQKEIYSNIYILYENTSVLEKNRIYSVNNIYMQKFDGDKAITEIKGGTTYNGNRTYIKGFFFNIK